jgi:uncharacterized Rmd1/YagE family protein
MRVHTFHALSFAENFPLKELAGVFPEAQTGPHGHRLRLPADGEASFYPFGAVVFRDTPRELRDEQLGRLYQAWPTLRTEALREEFTVREEEGASIDMDAGVLVVDRLTPARAGIVALTVAQSAAMEYYERIVDRLFDRMQQFAARMEKRGTVPMRTRPLHRFIAEAIGTRGEVLSILHLLDKPDEVWDDPAMDLIYADLRAEFDLLDRYGALESKLRAVQEGLELVLDVARDRRLVLLETAIVLLIVFEIVLSFL